MLVEIRTRINLLKQHIIEDDLGELNKVKFLILEIADKVSSIYMEELIRELDKQQNKKEEIIARESLKKLTKEDSGDIIWIDDPYAT